MKKTYTLTLDEEKVDELKVWLNERGLSFSGYINSLIDEQITAIELFAPAGVKKKVSTVQLIKMAGYLKVLSKGGLIMKKKKKDQGRNLNVKGIPEDIFNEFHNALAERGISIKFQIIKFIKVWLEANKTEEN